MPACVFATFVVGTMVPSFGQSRVGLAETDKNLADPNLELRPILNLFWVRISQIGRSRLRRVWVRERGRECKRAQEGKKGKEREFVGCGGKREMKEER